MCRYELKDYALHTEKIQKKHLECVKMYEKWENKCVNKELREEYKSLKKYDNFLFLDQ